MKNKPEFDVGMLKGVVHGYPLLSIHDEHLLQEIARVICRQPGVAGGVLREEVVGEEGREGGSLLGVLVLHVPPHRRLQPVDEALFASVCCYHN